jgi:coenzyme PQQ precursor peptide PqqA
MHEKGRAPTQLSCKQIVDICRLPLQYRQSNEGLAMTWTTPILVEISIALEINGYFSSEL